VTIEARYVCGGCGRSGTRFVRGSQPTEIAWICECGYPIVAQVAASHPVGVYAPPSHRGEDASAPEPDPEERRAARFRFKFSDWRATA
jgi:hypothetical protein